MAFRPACELLAVSPSWDKELAKPISVQLTLFHLKNFLMKEAVLWFISSCKCLTSSQTNTLSSTDLEFFDQ